MKLDVDLKDRQGHLIAAAEREITAGLLREVRKRGISRQKKFILLNQPRFLKDVRGVIHEKIYSPIFDRPGVRERILKLVRAARIQSDLLREILILRKTSYHTYRHFLLIGALAARMADSLKYYGFNPGLSFVYGLTHDIGKMRLAPRLLNKKDRLTRQEHQVIRSYPLKSLLLLNYYLGKGGREACRVAYEHHETLDGSGYPKGIKNLSKYTRLVAVADIFDALVAYRPYRRKQFSVRAGLDKLIHGMQAGKFPRLPVLLLISYFRKGQPNFRTLKISSKPRDPEPQGNSYGKFAR